MNYAEHWTKSTPLGSSNDISLNDYVRSFCDGFGYNAIHVHIAEVLVEIIMKKENLDIKLPNINDIRDALFEPFEKWDYFNLYMVHPPTVPGNVRRMLEYTWLSKELDIVRGDSDGYFRSYGEITRVELLTMIGRNTL